MQAGVLDAADILIDGQPAGGARIGASPRRCRGRRSAREIPRRFDESVESVGFASAPPRRNAGRRRGKTIRASRAASRARRRRHLPAAKPANRIRRPLPRRMFRNERPAPDSPNIAGAKRPNRASETALAPPVAGGGKFFDREIFGLRARQAVQKIRIENCAVAVVSGVSDRERFRRAPGGKTTGITGKPCARANSKSRWSCAGQP